MPLRLPFSAPKKNSHPDRMRRPNDKHKSYDAVAVLKIMKTLREADKDKDGCYDKEELKSALDQLGAYFPGWRANRCLLNADADNDGVISGDEIQALLEYLASRGYGNKHHY
ncbi:hypothetical protein VNO78_28798 [Psophocarpus tetragonolobus]|uniref:EF-hand domain-containing protein n=1 Tax=Psophocarpus tetragonolobus TaxID=3891 RepID=A0AAN9WZ66_PSOTE